MTEFFIGDEEESCNDKRTSIMEKIVKAARGKPPVRKGDWDEVFRLLCVCGVHPDSVVCPRSGDSLLALAATEPAPQACRQLIEMGASLRNGGKNSRTPLMLAVWMRDSTWGSRNGRVVGLLASTVNDQDSDGKTALMFASVGAGLFGSKRGNVEIVNQLIGIGADLSLRDRFGKTALMNAVASNEASQTSANTEVVELLEAGSIEAAAKQWFETNHRVEFSAAGEMIVAPKDSSRGAPATAAKPNGKSRSRAARADAKLQTIAKKIEVFFGLPQGCVALMDKKGRHLRGQDTIASLWEKHDR